MKRRSFISMLGAGAALPMALSGMKVTAFSRSPLLDILARVECEDRILVLVQMAGGNDGLNMIVPLDQYAAYKAARPAIAVPETGTGAALKLTNATGINPQMAAVQQMYANGLMRVIQNVGYPVPDSSHFRSTDIWMSASDSATVVETGWLGRWLDSVYPGFPAGYPSASMPHPVAISVGNFVTLSTESSTANVAMAFSNPTTYYNIVNYGSGAQRNTRFLKELDFIRTTGEQIQQFATPVKAAAAKATNKSTKYPAASAGNTLADQLKIVAQLIAGGLKTRVYLVTQTGYDTHANQLNGGNGTPYSHPALLNQLSVALDAFMDDCRLLGIDEKIVGMTFSEFGRRIQQNGSAGTDHGAAAPMLVFGKNVLGGGILGTNPVIPQNVTAQDNVPMQFDFRSVYASILRDWLCVKEADIRTLLMGSFPFLPIINTANVSDVRDDGTPMVKRRLGCSDNPASDAVTVWVESDGGTARLSLFDTTGREIAVVVEQQLAVGRHAVPYAVSALPSGTYYWRLQTSSYSQTSPMMVVH